MIVAKFGGSSLADSAQFKKVKAIVSADTRRRIIVPSAPGRRSADDYKITDVLYLCYEHVLKSVDFSSVFKLVEDRFIELRDSLALNYDIERPLAQIKREIEQGKTKDFAASRGEYLTGLLLAHYLNYQFIDPADLIMLKRSGTLDEQLTYRLLAERLSDTDNTVIPGFYGALNNGRIKTFSRGGSDISGAIIARGVAADIYENWTDVSGFLMADPNIVGESSGIVELSFRELRELSYMGANVFHEEAIFPLYRHGIPINIRNTNAPQQSGTMIVEQRTANTLGSITGISGKQNFTVIAIEKTLMKQHSDFVLKVVSILDKHNVIFEHMPSGIDSLSIIVSDNHIDDKLDLIIDDIEQQCQPDKICVLPNMALIAVVGEGMVRTKGISKKVFTALADSAVNIRMINQGSNELSIIVGVENEDLHKGIKAIYDAFKGGKK